MANRGAIVVVKAIAAGCTASVAIAAACDVDIRAKSIAGIGRTIEGVGGATVGVVARGRAISVADFVCFDNAVPATGTAIGIVVVIASTRTTFVTLCTGGHIRENTGCVAILCASAKRIGGAGKSIITGCGTISVTEFSCFDDAIGAKRRAIVIVEIIAAWSTAGIPRIADDDIRVRASRVTGC